MDLHNANVPSLTVRVTMMHLEFWPSKRDCCQFLSCPCAAAMPTVSEVSPRTGHGG